MAHVLVVDDEIWVCESIEGVLKSFGHNVLSAHSAETALEMMQKQKPACVLTDLRMRGMSGIDLLLKVKEMFTDVPVAMMTGHSSIDSAIMAMRHGAFDYLVKPFTPDQLEDLMFKMLQTRRKIMPKDGYGHDASQPLQSASTRMHRLVETVKKVSRKDSTILITGESGTGKSLLAKFIHERSPRSNGPFAVVNCATLSPNLLESELFGHVRGSFTGAIRDKIGRLQIAHGGTVFLDEIGEIHASLQTKLLRFLQDLEFERVGDTKTIRVDVRIVAATNRKLEEEVKRGVFREDLYFRLNVIDIHMPSLRERSEDLLPLAQDLLTQSFRQADCPVRPLSCAARTAILNYPWPGNIRELKNALERAAILCSGEEVTLEDLPERVIRGISETQLTQAKITSELSVKGLTLRELERFHIERVIAESATLELAAERLGINLTTLWRKRRRYGLREK